MDKKNQMQELVDALTDAQQSYTSSGKSTLSDKEYNTKMLELVGLEFELGYKLDNSPTQADGFIESVEMLAELSNGKGDNDE
jgi:NAD-dependent DNA ligase